MKVIAQTSALAEALALAGSIVQSRTPKPVLQCVKLIAEENMLTVLATDLEVGCRFQVAAVQVDEPGEALIPADRLNGIVRESSDETLTVETEKQTALVRGAGSRFKVFGYDPGEYPAVAEFDQSPDFEVQAQQLSDMISKTLFATAKAHSHYAISGVLWEADEKKLQLVATDGYRLAQAKGQLAKAATSEVHAIVPGKLTGLISRVAGGSEEMLQVKVLDNQILVRTARAVLVSSLVQGNFPKYNDVIPTDCDRKATIQTSEFEHRIRQAALLTNEESRGVKLNFQSEEVVLSSRAPEAGEAEVTCPIQLEGEPIQIGFNPNFLLEALRVIDADSIQLELHSSAKPAVIRAGADLLYVLMPVDLG